MAVDSLDEAQLRSLVAEQQEELAQLRCEQKKQTRLTAAALVESENRSNEEARRIKRLETMVQDGNKEEQELGKRVVELEGFEKLAGEREDELMRRRNEVKQFAIIKEELQEAQLRAMEFKTEKKQLQAAHAQELAAAKEELAAALCGGGKGPTREDSLLVSQTTLNQAMQLTNKDLSEVKQIRNHSIIHGRSLTLDLLSPSLPYSLPPFPPSLTPLPSLLRWLVFCRHSLKY